MPDRSLNPFVVAIAVISTSVVVFSALKVTNAVPELRFVMVAVAVGIGLILTAVGVLRADRASRGFISAVIDVFVWMLAQMSKSVTATLIVCLVAPVIAAGSYFLGPASIVQHNIICDKAGYIQIGQVTEPCEGILVNPHWFYAWNRSSQQVNYNCLDTDGKTSWKPEYIKTGVFRCGKIRWKPKDIASGILVDSLDADTVTGRRALDGLEKLRHDIGDSIAPRNVTDNLLIATWNLRKFNKSDRRLEETFFYMAQIISYFDIVAIQEVGRNISSLRKLMTILGDNWAVSYSGVGSKGSQYQRFAYIYDTRKIELGHFSSSVVLIGQNQLLRPPYLVDFKVGDREIVLCNVHIVWGRQREARREEVRLLSEYLVRQFKIAGIDADSLILLGDFQSESAESEQLQIIKNAGFLVDANLAALNTNYRQTRPYDQIAFLSKSDEMRVGRFGVIDFFQSVFTLDQQNEYYADKRGGSSYATWRTFQMSDHLPKWAEVRFSEQSSR